MDLQRLVDAMNAEAQMKRAGVHMTLGELVSAMTAVDGDLPVKTTDGHTVGDIGSYRGYYSDLALEPGSGYETVGALRQRLADAIGETFDGYKGGEFRMTKATPLWVSSYGHSSGIGVFGAEVREGVFTLITRRVDN